jgi:hypothetical protein
LSQWRQLQQSLKVFILLISFIEIFNTFSVSSTSAAVPISAAPQPRIALPVFDPKKPPPPLITHPSQLGASFSPGNILF